MSRSSAAMLMAGLCLAMLASPAVAQTGGRNGTTGGANVTSLVGAWEGSCVTKAIDYGCITQGIDVYPFFVSVDGTEGDYQLTMNKGGQQTPPIPLNATQQGNAICLGGAALARATGSFVRVEGVITVTVQPLNGTGGINDGANNTRRMLRSKLRKLLQSEDGDGSTDSGDSIDGDGRRFVRVSINSECPTSITNTLYCNQSPNMLTYNYQCSLFKITEANSTGGNSTATSGGMPINPGSKPLLPPKP